MEHDSGAGNSATVRGDGGDTERTARTHPLPLTRETQNRTPTNPVMKQTHGQRKQRCLCGYHEEGRWGVDWEVRMSRGKPLPTGRATRPDRAAQGAIHSTPYGKPRKRTGKRIQCTTESPAPQQKAKQRGKSTILQWKEALGLWFNFVYDDRSRSKSSCRQTFSRHHQSQKALLSPLNALGIFAKGQFTLNVKITVWAYQSVLLVYMRIVFQYQTVLITTEICSFKISKWETSNLGVFKITWLLRVPWLSGQVFLFLQKKKKSHWEFLQGLPWICRWFPNNINFSNP